MRSLNNPTPLVAELRPGWSRQRRFQDTLIIKVTWQFALDGSVQLAEEQPPLCEADEFHGDPLTSSLAKAIETVPYKEGAELYLFGTAHPPRAGVRGMDVSLRLLAEGAKPWQKTLAVYGPSQWQRSLLGHRRSQLGLLEPLPLQYEYAYGGSIAERDLREAANPAGRGFNPGSWSLLDERVAQIEWPDAPLTRPGQRSQPAGFAPLAAFWEPRKRAEGHFAEEQLPEDGCPVAPDAKPDLYNLAPLDQRFAQPFQGNLQVQLQGFFADHPAAVTVQLPCRQPQVSVGQNEMLPLLCDTLIIDADARQISLLYRAGLPQRRLKPVSQVLAVAFPEGDVTVGAVNAK